MFSWQCVSLIKMNFFLNFPRKIKETTLRGVPSFPSSFTYWPHLYWLPLPARLIKRLHLILSYMRPTFPSENWSSPPAVHFLVRNSPFSCFSHLALLTHHFYQHSNVLPYLPQKKCIKTSRWTSLYYRSLLLSGKGSAFCLHHHSYCFYPTLSPPPQGTIGMWELGLQPY